MNKKLFVLFFVLTVFVVGMSISGVTAKTMEIKTKWNNYKTKSKGKYTFEVYKYKTPSYYSCNYQEIDVWGYKKGKRMSRYKFKSKIHYKYQGRWRWSKWSHGDADSTYHQYITGLEIKVDKVMVKY